MAEKEHGSAGVRAEWLEIVRRKVAALDFGLVQIIVHDGRVVQIECTEKTRLDARRSRGWAIEVV